MCLLVYMKKNDTFIAQGTDYTYEGAGVVHTDGFVYFVPGLISGETAELGVTALKKNYGYARIVKLKEPSVHRVTPPCSVYRKCGGCQLMHMDAQEQKAFKENKVRGCFRMNADMEADVLPILTTEHTDGYRNKVQVPVQLKNGKTIMGFYRTHTNEIAEFDYCHVQTAVSNEIIARMRIWLEKYRCTEEFRHILIKHAHRTDQVMVCMIVRHYPFRNAEKIKDELITAFPQIRSISVIENRREDNVILSGKETVIYGDKYIEEELLGMRFRISARSFFQINPYATEILYSKALELADIHPEDTVVDLYCGTGTIGLLASRNAKYVYGIEIVDDAVKDAGVNAKINGRENIEFMTADAQAGANKLLQRIVRPDVVIVDPPRKGCSKETLNAVLKMSPKRFVYVSCDPATLARDVKYMRENGYEVQVIQPVDLFPGTYHIETIVLLQKLNS